MSNKLPEKNSTLRDHHDVERHWANSLRTDVVYHNEHTLDSEDTAIYLEDKELADEWILSDTFVLLTGTDDCPSLPIDAPQKDE